MHKQASIKFYLGNLTIRGTCIMIHSYNKTNEMH